MPLRPLAILALLVLAVPASAGRLRAGEGAAVRLRCGWDDPATGEPLQFVFPSPPLLVAGPESAVRCRLLRAGRALPVRAIVELDDEGAERARFALAEGATGVRFNAPTRPGRVRLALVYGAAAGEKRFPLDCYVPHPAAGLGPRGGRLVLGGEDLGRYADPARSRIRKIVEHPESYRPPRLFVALDDELEKRLLTPRVPAGLLVVPDEKTGKRHTRWFPIRYGFLQNLEALLAEFAEAGLPVRNLRFLSLFRAPGYNRSIGSAAFSRHPYGDAVDFFFDGDDNGVADDLDGDGRTTLADGRAVIALVEKAQAAGRLDAGGIGVYYFPYVTTEHRLTFHLDFRGHRATWGYRYDRQGRAREFEWQSAHFPPEPRRR
jgi:hypothetical protein